ncbi:MAG: hypothetical protein ACK44D_10080 [Bacteroidia bacterium]
MKKLANLLIVITLLTVLPFGIQAQERPSNKTIQVYVTKLQLSTELLSNFIASKNGVVYQTDLSTNRYYTEFLISNAELRGIDSLANKMGYVTQNVFNTENFKEKISNLEKRIDGLKYENSVHARQLRDSLVTGARVEELKRKISSNLQTIASLEVNINQLEQNASDQMCKVRFTINDEMSTPNNSRVSFVNMPGIEYGFLKIENPTLGVSAKAYQGATIKYMFTRGKSYFNLGVYRAMDNNTADTALINELFIINFGQDFYPRNFGRGKRRFLNLYTGYQIGGFISNQNNNKNSVFIPNANLSFGVELIKTKHILVDNKVSYFLPLNELNRNMRGILYQASFNFVF